MRIFSIINDLKEKASYCDIDYFISKYNVSKRTIQNDMAYLIRTSSRNGFQIRMKRGEGYLLEITNEKLFNDFMNSLDSSIVYGINERPMNILDYLAVKNQYVSMQNVADFFLVSKNVIKREMNQVEKLAKRYYMTFERKSHYGIRLFKDAKYLKKYLVDRYLNQNFIVLTEVNNIVGNFKDIENCFIEYLNEKNLNINYNELLNVIVFLKIMVFTSYIENEQDEKYEIDDSLYGLNYMLVELLTNKYNVSFNKKSKELLKEVLSKNIRKKDMKLLFSECLENDIEEFLRNIDNAYNTFFLKDKDFKDPFKKHVLLLIDRLCNKIYYKNPLANEISIKNPLIFSMAIQFANMIKDKYKFDMTLDEIGFIAIYFSAHMEKEKQIKFQSYNKIAVVCSSGGGSAYMLKVQIQSLFPKANIQTFSFLKKKELLNFRADLIFTVMDINICTNVPIIYIKELLNDNDLYRIKEFLQCGPYNPYISINNIPSYHSYFNKDFFKICNGYDYKKMISDMADELEVEGYGQSGYKNLVLERESHGSTIFLNGVCIPHPIETNGLKNVISICILNKPYVQDEKEIKVIFMICLKKDNIASYKYISENLYLLMNNINLLRKILSVKSFEEFYAIMKEV